MIKIINYFFQSLLIYLSFFIGNFITIIFFFYHMISFTSSGLFGSEIYQLKNILYFLIFILFTSFLLINSLIIPLLCNYFISLQESAIRNFLNFQLETQIMNYLFFYTSLLKTLYFLLFIYAFIYFYLDYLSI